MSAEHAPDHRGSAGLSSDRNTVLLFVGGTLLAVLGLVAVIATPFVGGGDDHPAAGVAADTTTTTSASPSPGSSSAPGDTTSAGALAVGQTGDGLALSAAVLSSTTFEVVETVRWPGGGPATIELALDEGAAAAAGLTIAPELTIASLQVTVDGTPVTPVLRAGSQTAWTVTPPAAGPASMEVRYILGGAIVRSVPSTPGRALGVITPISTAAAGDLPVAIIIGAADVLNVYCPTATTQRALLCGKLDGDHWTIEVPPGIPLVVAQLNLPAPA